MSNQYATSSTVAPNPLLQTTQQLLRLALEEQVSFTQEELQTWCKLLRKVYQAEENEETLKLLKELHKLAYNHA